MVHNTSPAWHWEILSLLWVNYTVHRYFYIAWYFMQATETEIIPILYYNAFIVRKNIICNDLWQTSIMRDEICYGINSPPDWTHQTVTGTKCRFPPADLGVKKKKRKKLHIIGFYFSQHKTRTKLVHKTNIYIYINWTSLSMFYTKKKKRKEKKKRAHQTMPLYEIRPYY